MKIFKDPELKEEINTIHFGKVEAGKTKKVTIYIYNDSEAIISNLEFKIPALPHTERLEVKAPITIQPKSVAPVTIEWTPSISFKQALDLTITITGEEIYTVKREV